MVERELFSSLRGFNGAYTKENRLSPLAQLMEDGSLCLQVLEHSRKIISCFLLPFHSRSFSP
jgi:hypothetical protein